MKRRMDEERMDKENAIQNESENQNENGIQTGQNENGIQTGRGTCAEAALLDAFLDGELSEDEADRVREHLDTCPDCRAYLDDILAIREAFPTLEDTEVPEGFAERTLDRLPPRISVLRGGGWRKQWRRTALPIAASLALILALRGMWLTGGPNGGGEVMSRTLPVVEETDEAAPKAQETVQDTEATETSEDAAEVSMMDAGTPEDTGSGAAETAEASMTGAGTPENGETADAANGETAGNDTDSAENRESTGNDTDSTAADSAPAGTDTAPAAAETSAGTDTASKPAGNQSEERKPANPKNSGEKPVTNSKTENSGKPSNGGKPSGGTNSGANSGANSRTTGGTSNGTTGGTNNGASNGTAGGTAAGGTGKQQAGTSAPPESAAVTESNAPAAQEPTVSAAEQTVPATEEQAEAPATEQPVPVEPPAPQVPDPENPRDGWVSRDWENGGSSPVSGYEETDSPISLLGIEDLEEAEARAGGEGETADGGEADANDGTSNEEAPNGGASNGSASGEPEVRNTAHRVMYLPPEAAPYMEQYRLSEEAADGTWYTLTGAQFKALARALEDTGLTDESKWASEAAFTGDGDTVYVVLRNG